MTTVTIDVSSQINVLTRTELQGLITGSLLTEKMIYVVSNAVGGTKRIALMALSGSVLSEAATNLTDAEFGTYNITTDVFTATAGGSGVESVTGDSVDNTDPLNPVVDAIPRQGTGATPVSGSIEIESGVEYFYQAAGLLQSIRVNGASGWIMEVQDLTSSTSTQISMQNGRIRIISDDPAFDGVRYDIIDHNNLVLSSLIDLFTLKSRFWPKAGVPTTSDDINEGFVVDSLIFDTSSDTWYKCTSNAVGAATWTALSSGGSSPVLSLVSTPSSNITSGLTRFIPVGGSNSPAAASGSYTGVVPRALTTVNAVCNLVFGGTTSGASTITLFKNGAATSLVITIPTGSTQGRYAFASAVSFVDTDTWVWEVRSPSGSPIQVNNVVLNYQ